MLQFRKKFLCSDVNVSEFQQLCKLLVEIKHRYLTHGSDVGKMSTPFGLD